MTNEHEHEPDSATILIVEDERGLADLYAEFLGEKYSVITAYDGTEGLEAMDDDIDVVLLDRRMPGLSGEEVLDAIREQEYTCRVAMVTAVNPDIDIIAMGFDDYLTKPIDREELFETVGRLLELNSYDDLMEEYYQLVSKKAVLETEMAEYDLSEHDEFVQLMERIGELEAELHEQDAISSETDIRSFLGVTGGE